MGTNVHAFAHRLTALSMACLASMGLICCCLSGFGCSFIQINALEGESIGNAYGDVYENVATAYLGVQCFSERDAPFYDTDGTVDRLWNMSRIFLYTGLALGTMTTVFAWMLGSCVRPTAPRWRILSVFSACSAVIQIPIFLIFESDSCNFDITRQNCQLNTGAYINTLSVSIWIVMTIWVQCLRAPRWDEELDVWRVGGDIESVSSWSSGVEKDINGTVESKRSEDTHSGVGGNGTAKTTEIERTPPRNKKESNSFNSPIARRDGETKDDTKKQLQQQHENRKLSLMKSVNTNLQRVRSSPESNASQPVQHEAPISTKRSIEPIASRRDYGGVPIGKSATVDTGDYAVNQSQSNDIMSSSQPTNRPAPGFHVSCVHTDGTRQDVHFSSLNCCIGMGDPVDEDETKFQTFSAGYNDYNDKKNGDSDDFLVRKLRKEEAKAAARRKDINMAPVASFEFVARNNLHNGDRTNNRNNGKYDDDVSEMTRGSGWASGVSEILDDTDLRHQPKSMLEDLTEHY